MSTLSACSGNIFPTPTCSGNIWENVNNVAIWLNFDFNPKLNWTSYILNGNNSSHIKVIIFQNICKKGYNNRHVVETHTFQCFIFKNFLNLGVFKKNYAAGGSMNKCASNGMCCNSVFINIHCTYTHTHFNFIAGVCLRFFPYKGNMLLLLLLLL